MHLTDEQAEILGAAIVEVADQLESESKEE